MGRAVIQLKIDVGGRPKERHFTLNSPKLSISTSDRTVPGNDLPIVRVNNDSRFDVYLHFQSTSPCNPSCFRVKRGRKTPLPWKGEVERDEYRYTVSLTPPGMMNEIQEKIEPEVDPVEAVHGEIDIEAMNE